MSQILTLHVHVHAHVHASVHCMIIFCSCDVERLRDIVQSRGKDNEL